MSISRRLSSDDILAVWKCVPVHCREDVFFIDPLMLDRYFKGYDLPKMQIVMKKAGFPKRFILFPVNVDKDEFKHWFLMACDRQCQSCVVYDSMRGVSVSMKLAKTVFSKMIQYKMIDKETVMTTCLWYPQQEDSYSCGHRVIIASHLILFRGRLLEPEDEPKYNSELNKFIDAC